MKTIIRQNSVINRRELQKTLRKYENYTFFHHTKILLFRMSVTRSFFTLCEYINTISTVHIMLLPGQKPSSYPLLKFVYATSQLRHSIVVHHLLRKVVDPPLRQCFNVVKCAVWYLHSFPIPFAHFLGPVTYFELFYDNPRRFELSESTVYKTNISRSSYVDEQNSPSWKGNKSDTRLW